jgi:hypothetical protein
MVVWSETTLKRELKGFEDGLNDARRRTVDPIVYQINREYRSGVDIAQQLMARLNVALNEVLNRSGGSSCRTSSPSSWGAGEAHVCIP